MEEKYGAKFGEAKTLFIAVSGVFMLAVIVFVAGVAVLGYGLSKGAFKPISIPLLVVGLALIVYCVKTLSGTVTCYENGIVIKETFKTTEIKREDIAAIYWEHPGANSSNEKVRTNVNTADIILIGGRRHYKISDGYYSNVEVLGRYQQKYNIPQEIKH